MKSRTFVSLAVGLALFGPVPFSPAGEAVALPKAPAVAVPNISPSTPVTPLPSPPETATAMAVRLPTFALPEGVSLSGWLGELVKLAEGGLDQSVQLSFVDSAGTFNLDADKIIYLHDIGIASEVITTIIQHDAEIVAGLRQATTLAPPSGSTIRPPDPSLLANQAPGTASKPVNRPLEAAVGKASPPPEEESGMPDPLDFFEVWNEPEEKPELSPVRKPYAVQLTAPIVVYRAQGRIPNTTLLQTLP